MFFCSIFSCFSKYLCLTQHAALCEYRPILANRPQSHSFSSMADMKLTLIPIIFIVLRIWSTVRFILLLAGSSARQNPVLVTLHVSLKFLLNHLCNILRIILFNLIFQFTVYCFCLKLLPPYIVCMYVFICVLGLFCVSCSSFGCSLSVVPTADYLFASCHQTEPHSTWHGSLTLWSALCVTAHKCGCIHVLPLVCVLLNLWWCDCMITSLWIITHSSGNALSVNRYFWTLESFTITFKNVRNFSSKWVWIVWNLHDVKTSGLLLNDWIWNILFYTIIKQ